jgi:hypothetical protein
MDPDEFCDHLDKKPCKCGSWDTIYAPDPYNHDIHDDDTPVWMCERCREESALDI